MFGGETSSSPPGFAHSFVEDIIGKFTSDLLCLQPRGSIQGMCVLANHWRWFGWMDYRSFVYNFI
jgi:hypothetical protein